MFKKIKQEWSEMTLLTKIVSPLTIVVGFVMLYYMISGNPIISLLCVTAFYAGSIVINNEEKMAKEKIVT